MPHAVVIERKIPFQVHNNFTNEFHKQLNNHSDKITKQHKEFEVIILDCINSRWGNWLAENNPNIQSLKSEEWHIQRPNIWAIWEGSL